MMRVPPVMIMAGGTGGHVMPALAVAEELRSRGIPVVWLGTRTGIEAKLVPEAGYPIEWLSISGWRGKDMLTTVLAPLRLVFACAQAMRILWRRKPCAVLGMGGFVSGPGGLMAWIMRKPLVIHEQNAIAGLTNKYLALVASQVLEAFPGSLGEIARQVGNPVRRNIVRLAAPELRLRDHDDALRLLVIGGSLGAVRLNEIVPEAIASLAKDSRPQIIHQSGSNNIGTATAQYKRHGVDALVKSFIEDMAEVYAWADLVICRAGAMTVFELAAAGVASILVPYPHAVDDHQTANADYLARVDAAIVIQQHELTSEKLRELVFDLTHQRERLLNMARAAREVARPGAAHEVADICLQAGGLT